jgi:hypothetical protein
MNAERINTALPALLSRHNDDAFVIFEERESGKYVQFAGSVPEPLLPDLPSQALTAEEEQRAALLFSELGSGNATSANLYDRPLWPVVGRQISYQLAFGQDSGRAAEVTTRIFNEVYHLPPAFALSITEN